MPRPTIDWYITLDSIWSHIGEKAIYALRDELGAQFRYVVMNQWKLFDATGGVQLRRRHVVRQRWRDVEIQRWCVRRGVTLDLTSPWLRIDKSLAERVAVAALAQGHDVEAYLRNALRAIYEEARDISDPATIAAVARASGLPGEQLVADASLDDVVAQYERNVREAVEADVFGTPTFVWNGEVFWGQDRLEFLAEAVRSGRAPTRPWV